MIRAQLGRNQNSVAVELRHWHDGGDLEPFGDNHRGQGQIENDQDSEHRARPVDCCTLAVD